MSSPGAAWNVGEIDLRGLAITFEDECFHAVRSLIFRFQILGESLKPHHFHKIAMDH